MLTLREQPVPLRRFIPETFVAWLWEHRRAPGTLQTVDGRPVQVIYPGWRAFTWGPDYVGALLSIDGSLVRGDVELHVHARDWHSHGHATDPAYCSTVLHVVYHAEASLPTVRLDGVVVPIVPLQPFLQETADVLWDEWQQEDVAPAPVACRSASEAGWLLDRAGDERFEARAARFEGDLQVVSPEQALWAGLLETLGYSANVAPFRALADQVTWQEASWTFHRSGVLALEAQLLGAAGLLPAQRGRMALGSEAQQLEQIWRENGGESWSLSSAWSWRGVRPGNNPVRRVAAAASIVAEATTLLSAGSVRACLFAAQPAGVHRALRRLIQRTGSSYWQSHADFDRPLGHSMAVIGADRASAAVVNVVLPWLAALGHHRDDDELVHAALSSYRDHPPLGWNRVWRHMAEQIAGSDSRSVVTNARRQQGLLSVYRGWCAARHCEECPAGGKFHAPERGLPLLDDGG